MHHESTVLCSIRTRRSTSRRALGSAILCALIGLGGPVLGQKSPSGAPGNVESQVLQASGDWFNALMSGDIQTLDRLQMDDFLTVQKGRGAVAVVSKAQQMENLRKAGKDRPKFERTLTAVKVREYGNVAILTALATFKQSAPRRTVSQAVITEVWVRDNGPWRLAHFQPTDVPAK